MIPSAIPYHEVEGPGEALHFAHANGYPPAAYQSLFNRLSDEFHVYAMHMRPLWIRSDPRGITNWKPFSDDLRRYLEEHCLSGIIGAGHSLGATITLRLALSDPDRFKKIFLIEPILFPPSTILIWRVLNEVGLGQRFHPMIKRALKRKTRFDDLQKLFDHYRAKPIFAKISDENLAAYVRSITLPSSDGSVSLVYPPEWEARIYFTGMIDGMDLWRQMHRLKPPLFVLQGDESYMVQYRTIRLIQKRLPSVKIETITGATHLAPLEQPEAMASSMKNFLKPQ